MADMYGAIKSNEFKVKDADYFEQWFLANVSFGNDITIYREVDKEGITSFMFGNPDAYYPNAYPKKAYDEEAA